MEKIFLYFRRVLFFASFVIAGLAVSEKVLSLFRYTLVGRFYTPGRLMEFAALGLLFVLVLYLREIKIALTAKNN